MTQFRVTSTDIAEVTQPAVTSRDVVVVFPQQEPACLYLVVNIASEPAPNRASCLALRGL